MAPMPKGKPLEPTLPLADYFWIAGLDTQQLVEAYKPMRWSYEDKEKLSNGNGNGNDYTSQDVIHEEENYGQDDDRPLSRITSYKTNRRDSYQRLSDLSDEARNAIAGLDNASHIRSNRSSATIRAAPLTAQRMSNIFTDQDFEVALQKFTIDRESFSLDLGFNNGTTTRPKTLKPRPRTQKIVPEDLSAPTRGLGSMRRHLSFKEMNSSKRTVARQFSSRTSRRVSTYNSVVPSPERLYVSPDHHPLRRKFEPVLLDRYPRSDMSEELAAREKFPEYVPMFAFPNDIAIVSSDIRPRSTWHQFSMTAADNSKIPAVCVVVYVPMSRQTADELERRCEEWRRDNMSEAERELASSLGERLASERAKLSRLLAQLPQIPSGSDERDELEDEIGVVEERIAVMADMLRPWRHGAASKIEGLTDGDTGLWIPRAYGILGRSGQTAFWRQWLRAVVVPMMDGAIMRVPASSPKVGMWQPLERYVRNLCINAPCPVSSKNQIDLTVRELHLYAKQEATNELPGSRTTDLYPLFRALTIPNIVVLLEYVLAEARVILMSSHTAMLQLASKAILELIWPLQWAGVYIPVLPARLIQALEAPCPYICGVLRTYDKFDLPEDDFVLVDLDKNEIQSTAHPPALPKQQRRKLMSLLHLAAPHHHSYGVAPGPPSYTMETFPHNAFAAEYDSIFTGIVRTTNLSKLVSLSSNMFGAQAAADVIQRAPVLNVFAQSGPTRGHDVDRPNTASTARQASQNDPENSPSNPSFYNPPMTPVSRNDSGYALQTSLREKRSGHFDSFSRRNESFSGIQQTLRHKASLPFPRHGSTPSNASMSPDVSFGGSTYAPSTYAQSTLAASTIMPGLVVQPARNTATTSWVEGHCLQWRPHDGPSTCVLCDDKAEDGFYRCSGCGFVVHGRCAEQITVVCPSAFYPDQVRAAFVRMFASLFYTYRKYLVHPDAQQMKKGMTYQFNMDAFARSLPPENSEYIEVLRQTQAFNEFIAEREYTTAPPSPSIALFDAIILAKRNRTGRFAGMPNLGRGRNPFSFRSPAVAAHADILGDTSMHQWRIISIPGSSDRPNLGVAAHGRDYHTIVTRTPGRLEDELLQTFMLEAPPQVPQLKPQKKRLDLKGRLNGLGMNAP